jgi:hypothetical protein
MINDSGSEIDKEFLEIFMDESEGILLNLKNFLASFKEPEDVHYFEKYGQQVDRLMGAAYTLSLNFIGDLAKMGKEIGYKSTQLNEPKKLIIIHSLLGQLHRALDTLVKSLRAGIQPDVHEYHVLLQRLKMANESLGNLRATLES